MGHRRKILNTFSCYSSGVHCLFFIHVQVGCMPLLWVFAFLSSRLLLLFFVVSLVGLLRTFESCHPVL